MAYLANIASSIRSFNLSVAACAACESRYVPGLLGARGTLSYQPINQSNWKSRLQSRAHHGAIIKYRLSATTDVAAIEC